jgi:hypothetical protein
MKRIMALTIMGLAAFVLHVSAQEDGGTRRGPPPSGGNRPKPPIESALDANGDGVISAEEMANASAALKTLDKNGDGQLTADEFRPAMPRR